MQCVDDMRSDCALGSESSEDDLEDCSSTESPAEIELITHICHKGRRRLAHARSFQRDKKAAQKDNIGVVDRAGCVGGVSLLRRGVSLKRQTFSSEGSSFTCPVASASEHSSMRSKPLPDQF